MNKNKSQKSYRLGSSSNTFHHNWSERWQIVKDYYDYTIDKREHLSLKQRDKWRKWLMKEASKADHSNNNRYRSKAALKKRIKAKWWAVNHRYADDKNKRRNAMKRFILHQASYQELYRVQKWIVQRKHALVEKGRQTSNFMRSLNSR